MENKTLKTREKMSSSLDKDLYRKIKELSKETRIPISRLLDEAISDLLIKHKEKR